MSYPYISPWLVGYVYGRTRVNDCSKRDLSLWVVDPNPVSYTIADKLILNVYIWTERDR